MFSLSTGHSSFVCFYFQGEINICFSCEEQMYVSFTTGWFEKNI